MENKIVPAIWFPTVRTGTGTDVFTERLVEGLIKNGIKAEITWLPLRAEYAPWTVAIPQPPEWATIVHVNTWLHSRFLPKNLPVIATLHHSTHNPNLRPYKNWLRATYHQYWIAPNERRVMQQAMQVIAVSQFVADMAKKTLCDVPIQVVHNGVDTKVFCPSSNIRQEIKPFRLLYIGSWKKLKGVDLFPSIMYDLGENFQLYYTGGISANKEKIIMPNNMYDLGKLSQQEVIKEMQSADLLLFPSRSEGLPLVVIEAMACGLPVVTTNSSVLPELVDHGKTGFLCEKDNIHDFIQTIQYMKNHPTACKNMGNNARDISLLNFDINHMITKYIQIYLKNNFLPK